MDYNRQIPNSSVAGLVPSPLSVGGAQGITKVYWAQPIGGTAQGALGGSNSATGTVSTAVTPGSANFGRFRRTVITSAAGAGSSGSSYTGYARWARGSTGGFEAQLVFGLATANTTGYSAFAGFSQLTAGLTATDITTLLNMVGVGFDAADLSSGTWSLYYNDGAGAATKTPIVGMTRNTTDGFIMKMSCPKGAASNITVSIFNAVSGAVVLAPTVLSSNLPTANVPMAIGVHSYNGAIAAACAIQYNDLYVTCDY